MFTHPRQQQHQQQLHQKLQRREASIAGSMAQSLADFSALPGFGVDSLRANPNLFGSFDHFNELDREVEGGGPRKQGREEHDQEQEDGMVELDLFIRAQVVEKARAEIEQKRRRLWAGVVGAVEDGIRRVLKAKDDEIASAARYNSALEERINVLALEGQTWKALARTSEAAAAALRRDIDMAQQAAWDTAGCGGQVEDSVSCCEGSHDGEEEEEGQGECGGSPARRCRVCRKEEVSRLVLPCRHLCLCGCCDSATESCPLCGSRKKASIEVYLS